MHSDANDVFNIVAPGETKHPVSLMTEKKIWPFPVIFPKGRFRYMVERAVCLSPTRYFNARLSNYSNRFAMNADYLFFAQFIKEQEKESDSINIAVTKIHGLSLTASNLRSSVQSL